MDKHGKMLIFYGKAHPCRLLPFFTVFVRIFPSESCVRYVFFSFRDTFQGTFQFSFLGSFRSGVMPKRYSWWRAKGKLNIADFYRPNPVFVGYAFSVSIIQKLVR
jgi:hypothetical protein